MKKYMVLILFGFMFSPETYSQWSQITGFGTNPGSLNMYCYIPDSVPVNAPLVMVMHGCTETATSFSSQTAWDMLADKYKFYVAYAEQLSANNTSQCFNWFQPADYSRGQGEALSVKQMIDYMKSHHSIDSTKIFVTGLSAGACFTSVMMGAYPEIFAAGAVMAGCPYKAATNSTEAFNAMYGLVTKTPQQWGDLVRNENPSYSGNYPRVAVFQGSSDFTVYPVNAKEVMKQWTNVHNVDTVPDSIVSAYNGNSLIQLKKFNNTSGTTVVQTYMISSMGHGISVDPGTCFQQGGVAGSYSFDENFYSSFWAAQFFGLVKFPYSITGPITVLYGQQNITFSVPQHSGSTYTWTVPSGAVIVSGQGTNQIVVNWGSASGYVRVNETNSSSCIIGPIELYVEATTNTGVQDMEENILSIYTDQQSHTIVIFSDLKKYDIYLFDLTGRLIFKAKDLSGNANVKLPTDMKNGIYTAQVISVNNRINRKIVFVP
jgi:poly(hydroxyalkanoate) depolymerase family esterase